MEQIEIPLSDAEFTRIRARVQREAGISLSEAKRQLVVSRLSRLVRSLGLSGFTAYLDHLDHGAVAEDRQAFINALTTNLTRFFREEHHFDHLVAHVGKLMAHPPRRSADGRPRLRLWSAGCSTGQEPYTMAMALLASHPGLKSWDFRILATDVDTDVLARAASGRYAASEADGLTPARRAMFLADGDGHVRIPQAAHGVVTFKPLNLMDPWPMRGPFDAIFCRNVVIYFDKPTQMALFRRMVPMLVPEGCLYIGHSETLPAGELGLASVGRTIFSLRAGPGRRAA
ncbi:MCP methyltransferase, CheR-type [Devosia enhydra]|uniref:Chemotaxis protein methyltransferase n=1 Tax=Devosia enhydra TaxID=665118 RepID=A0A1K2HZP2_9HYPH|nr:protein-glutamate O-methyltransferase [Devosia enhydra]SFZ85613.1 MCP methyltransferase, CheR-type [Devosia enhydra]